MEHLNRRRQPDLFVSKGSSVQEVLDRLRAEYLEMPGLRLKPEQVQRLCGIERTMCQLALDSLLESKFLCVKSDGHYARLTDGTIHDPPPAKADLRTDMSSKKAS
jgi:hypothetical protein